MSREREQGRTKLNKGNLFVYGVVVLLSALRLAGQESGRWLWVDVLLLVAGAGGIAMTVLRPSGFARRR